MAENTTFVQMENKQKFTNVLPKESFDNRFDRFIIDATERVGDYIIEDAIDEMADLGVGSTIFDGEVPAIAEVSYNTRSQHSYVYNVRKDELKKVANSEDALNTLKDKINANLDEQDRKNCYRQFPKILSKNAGMKTTQKVVVSDKTDYASIILAIKQDISDLREPTDLFTEYTKVTGSGAKQVTHTLKSFSKRPIVFIREDLYNELMVKYASGVYNLDKISLDADIVLVREFYKDDLSAVDPNKLWITAGEGYVKIYKDFENRANFEDLRSTKVGKAVDYIEYTSKLVPAKLHYVQAQ